MSASLTIHRQSSFEYLLLVEYYLFNIIYAFVFCQFDFHNLESLILQIPHVNTFILFHFSQFVNLAAYFYIFSLDTNKRVSLNLSKKLRNTLFYGFGSMILKYPDNLGIYPTSLFAFFANKYIRTANAATQNFVIV